MIRSLDHLNSESQKHETHTPPSTQGQQQQHQQQQQQKLQKAKTESQDGYGECWGARHTVALLLCLGLIADYMAQSIMGVTIVAMVGSGALENGTKGNVCPLPDGQNITDIVRAGDFDWDEQTQGFIIGSMNIGSLLAAFPAGRVAEMYGGRFAFGVMVTATCVLCFLLPMAAYTSMYLFMFVRALQGFTLAGIFSSLNVVMVTWFPPQERPKFFSIILTGMNLGTLSCSALSGWLSELEWMGGWPAVFYVVGGIGAMWGILWFSFVHATPEEHPAISHKELTLILDGGRTTKKEMDGERKKFPWASALRSPAVWIQASTAGAESFNSFIIMSMVPSFLANIQYFSLESAGVIAALPYLLSMIVSVGWGCIVGRLMASNILSKRRIKQLSTAMGFYIPAACMLGMTQVGCNSSASVALLVICVGASACNYAGFQTTYQDLSPTYCGTLMGFGQLMASVACGSGPLMVGFMINETQTLEAWNNVFLTSSLVYLVFCTLYLYYTPMQQQSWDSAVTTSSQHTSYTSSSCCPRSAEDNKSENV